MPIRAFVSLAATLLLVHCGPTAPSSLSTPGEIWPPSHHWAPDHHAVVAAIVEEFRGIGVDVEVADRFAGQPFGAGSQRLAIPSVANNNVYLYIYRSAEHAADEASRITPDGQLRPAEGPPRESVLWAGTQHFYRRDRVIAQHAGCDTAVVAAMRTLFGAPLVVTSSPCRERR